MFDFFSFGELFLIAVVGMLVIGPQRLPEALRTLGLWFGRMRRSFTNVKAEIEREVGMDEVRRQLHNESIMAEMKRLEEDVRGTVQDTKNAIHPPAAGPASAPASTSSDAAANTSDDGTANHTTPAAADDHADTRNGKD